MSLTFLRVRSDSTDRQQIDEIMKRQFPPEEYMSIDHQLLLQDQGEAEIWGLYEDQTLVGLTTLRVTREMAYLFFLAFDTPYQGKGYGQEAIRKIRDLYADKAITVDFELIDPNAKNNAQRKRRRDFYQKCGFVKTDWGLSYLGVNYEIFCLNKPFQIADFQSMLNDLPIVNFHPRYFKLQA
jgi:GNAT superfamily N-acetyltransferase